VREGDLRVCVAAVERTGGGLKDIVPVGAVLPLDRGSGGRVLLAWAGGGGGRGMGGGGGRARGGGGERERAGLRHRWGFEGGGVRERPRLTPRGAPRRAGGRGGVGRGGGG